MRSSIHPIRFILYNPYLLGTQPPDVPDSGAALVSVISADI